MQMKPLKELLQDLEQEILKLGYTEGSMKFYRNRWMMLTKFAEEKGEIYYSEKLGIDFIEKYFHISMEPLHKQRFKICVSSA